MCVTGLENVEASMLTANISNRCGFKCRKDANTLGTNHAEINVGTLTAVETTEFVYLHSPLFACCVKVRFAFNASSSPFYLLLGGFPDRFDRLVCIIGQLCILAVKARCLGQHSAPL